MTTLTTVVTGPVYVGDGNDGNELTIESSGDITAYGTALILVTGSSLEDPTGYATNNGAISGGSEVVFEEVATSLVNTATGTVTANGADDGNGIAVYQDGGGTLNNAGMVTGGDDSAAVTYGGATFRRCRHGLKRGVHRWQQRRIRRGARWRSTNQR